MKKNRKSQITESPTSKPNKEYSKKLATIILIIALIDIQLTYVLAFFGKESIAETLSVTLVTEVVAVFGIYCAKAFWGKKNEEEMKFEKEKFKDGCDENN